jgi:hypothetical protein
MQENESERREVKGTRLVARLNRASWDLSSYLVPHGTFFLDLAKGLLLSMGAPLLPADANDWKQVFDLKLMDGIHEGWSPSSASPRDRFRPAERVHCFGSDGLLGTTPAARITLRTPAAKPRSRNTIIPQGEIPNQ